MSLNNKSQLAKIKRMSKKQRIAYFASAKRVTVSRFHTIKDHSGGSKEFVTQYVAKIRGVVVGDGDKWKHDTYEQALAFGKAIHESDRKQAGVDA